MIIHLRILLSLLLIESTITAQDSTTVPGSRAVNEYVKNIDSKAGHLSQQLDKFTAKALRKFQKQEAVINRKLAGKDSLKAMMLLGNAAEQYKQLEQRLQNTNSIQQYIPAFDTISTSLKFLQQNPQLASIANGTGKLKETLARVNGLGGKLGKAEEIKKFLKNRKQLLKEQLGQLGFARQLKKLNKKSFYYNQRLNEYESLLKDHKKAERKALELLSKSLLFKNFMRKNSMLASLFRLPGDPDDPVSTASLAGLQTRAQVTGLIQQQIANAGPNALSQLQQNVQEAQGQLTKLKNKITQSGEGNSDAEIPDGFRKNNQRVKSFWKKWELSVNTQSNKPNSLFPVTTDLSMLVGFRPHDRYVVGVGIGGLIGWGKDIRHIDVSSQGMSIKSFAEIKLKGSFHFATGYEMNYRSEIRSIEQLNDYSAWSRSGFAGISKVVSIKSKFFKKVKAQLLWDFLSYNQIPRVSQPVVFRVGYLFK